MSQKDMLVTVANRGYSAHSLFYVSANIGFTNYIKEVVFVEIRNGVRNGDLFQYSKDDNIKMKFDSIELRALAYAMKEILKHKSNELGYSKFTKTGNMRKKLVLGYTPAKKASEQDTFYININDYSVAIPKYDFAALADSLMLIANETETIFYKYQRAKERQR